ncbi:MAG: hypothetical protein H5T62_09010 [Anaerolineae bacterium]|nr:hypothetical protein [Anaerolineae bacterium]
MSEEQSPLSEREMEILRLVATGATNRQIARELFISPNTVKVHLRNIFAKLEVGSRTEATMFAIRQGWVTVEESGEVTAVAVTPPVTVVSLPRWKRVAFFVVAALVFSVFLVSQLTTALPTENMGNALTDRQAGSSSSARREETSRWTARSPLLRPRARMAVAAVGNLIYVIGGDTANGVTAAVEVYDAGAGTWAALTPKPTAVANVGAAVLDGQIYVPGGYTAEGQVTASMEVYDPTTDTWREGVPLPVPLCAYAIAAWEGHLYVFGGWNGESYVNSLYIYDSQAGQWRSGRAMQVPRGFAGAGVVGDTIYIVGGYDGGRELPLCEMYRPAENTWASCAPMSVGRGGVGVAVVGSTLYACGRWVGELSGVQ